MNEVKFLTIEDVEKMLYIKKQTLYRMTCSKQIPHYKIGGKLLFKREDILSFVESKKVEPILWINMNIKHQLEEMNVNKN